MRIADLVSMDASGDLPSDVQLSHFGNRELNEELLRNYIFTVHAPTTYGAQQRSLAAWDVLEQLRTLFVASRGENRILLTANYGHGKSHLALVLANLFARPAGSREVKIILDRLQQALNDPPKFGGYRDFKRSKGEFLVVRLQGDAVTDLQDGFVRALEQALSEHPATQGLEIPFWSREAYQWLVSLNDDARQRASDFLAMHGTDVPTLQADLTRQGAYQLVRELSKHVTGFYYDFGREATLEELVLWAVDQVCVPHKLGGLLVLFDEFSLFLQKYMAGRTPGKLQELLNGISKSQGKSAFIAFSQLDVETVAENYAPSQRREDARKELDRLPKNKRAGLYSLMESVLASYLKQDMANWDICFGEPAKRGYLNQARIVTQKHFHKRYGDELKWDAGQLYEKVVTGCFPLHPMTTAILSAHAFDLGAGGNPRTALQFIRQTWPNLHQQPVRLPDSRPNFVYAAALVDFFGEQISQKWYTAYRSAIEASPEALSEDQRKVLQGLLVQQAVDLKAARSEQIDLLHHLSGVDRDAIKDHLKQLAQWKVVYFDPVRKVSYLRPTAIASQEVEEVIQKAVAAIPIDTALMKMIADKLPPLEVSSLKFGHTSDWSPQQVAITAGDFTVEALRSRLQPVKTNNNAIEDPVRGLVVWLIAQNEEEKARVRQTAQEVLDAVNEGVDSPLPVVIVMPKRATPGLINAARQLQAMETLSTSDRDKIGTVVYQDREKIAQDDFRNSLKDLFEVDDLGLYADIPRKLEVFALPGPYRVSVQALKIPTLKTVVTECYAKAYAYRVQFYERYAVSGRGPNKLRDATQRVARWLFSDTAGSGINSLGQQAIEYNLAMQYLMQAWGMLAPSSYNVQPPTLRALREAWDVLEGAFPAGCSDVLARPIILELLNPPYGHDYNTLILLLAAWIGFHKHEIHPALGGKLVSISQLQTQLDDARRPQEFLNRLCITTPLSISRAKPDEMFAQVNAVLEHIRQAASFTIVQAQEALTQLEQAAANPVLPETKRDEIGQLRPRLEEALQRALEYDQKARTWQGKLSTSAPEDLLKARKTLTDLPSLLFVTATQPSLEELTQRWETEFRTALAAHCAKYAKLNDLSDYSSYKNRLNRVRKELGQYPVFAQQVDQALTTLANARANLEKQEEEKSMVAEINQMALSAALVDLYAYRERLTALTDLSSQTAKLRDDKLNQISGRIKRHEQTVVELPQAVDRVVQLSDVRQQRNLLLSVLGQLQGTQFYQTMLDLQKRIEQLEGFFEALRDVDLLPRNTPDALSDRDVRLVAIETEYSAQLSPIQLALLSKKRAEIEDYRRQETRQARVWLADLEQRHKAGESPESLLRRSKGRSAFLPPEDIIYLEQLSQLWQQRLDESVLLQIESLFQKIAESEIRRQCVQRLQALLDGP